MWMYIGNHDKILNGNSFYLLVFFTALIFHQIFSLPQNVLPGKHASVIQQWEHKKKY